MALVDPTEDDLRKVICKILKEADFNTATNSGILKELSEHFNTDLTPRKPAIRLMIWEELTELAGEAKDEDKDGGKGETEEEPQHADQEVLA